MNETFDIIREVLSALRSEIVDLENIKVEKVCLGLSYTGVSLETGHAGVCYTLRAEMASHCCQLINRAGTLAGSSAVDLAHLAESWDMSERVVGLAAVNALSQIVFEKKPQRYQIKKRNLIEELEVKRNDTVVLVGNIRPFVPVIKSKASLLYILERNPKEEGILPDIACEEVLPKADVVIITGSTIANGTLDRLIELSGEAREVAVSGPTASFIPDPLFRRGVDFLGGVQINNVEKMFQIIAEGGGTPQLKVAVEFVVIKPSKAT